MMYVYENPFFWAFISMFGLLVGTALVSGIPTGLNALLGFATVMVNDFARILLVLPFVIQPRFDLGAWNWILGGILIAAAMGFGLAAFSVKWWKAPDSNVILQTAGVYGIVRNPIYLTDLLFSLGIAVAFGSVIGVALIPVWWMAFLFVVRMEEQSMERALGQAYLDYKNRVKGRILPGLPV
jgi:protein-S-isoprenylcysteine O-methyltransferase Ste14